MVCMKVFAEALFFNLGGDMPFIVENTVLIDDTLEKGICNYRGNNIILESWNHNKRRDNFCMEDLLSWLHRLYSDCQLERLREYVEANRIGRQPLVIGHFNHQQIVDAMKESATKVGVRYEL